MGKKGRLFQYILMRKGDANVSFNDLCNLLEQIGFSCRIKGDHHIFWMKGIDEILNIQPKGSKAKAYQVAQVRDIIIRYKLTFEDK